jgi:protein-tyrosine phosphatase
VLRRIADPRQRPLLYHCTGGNHRSGWMTVILLKTLGVPDDVIRQDYLMSTGSNQTYLDAAYDQVRRDYGTFDRYLQAGLGVSPALILRLRLLLLDPASGF